MDRSYNTYNNLRINFSYMLSENSKTKYFLLLFCIFLAHVTSVVYAVNDHVNDNKNLDYPFIFDPPSSSYTSASCLISARSLLNRLDDRLIDKKLEENFWVRWPNLVVNNLFNDLFMLWQHEVNGHGFRQSFLGKKYWGSARITFVIDGQGKIAQILDRVKANDHVAQILR